MIVFKKIDYIFWFVLILIALFYVFKGNDIHNEKFELIKKNEVKQQN